MYPANIQEMQATLNAAFGYHPSDAREAHLRAKVCNLWGQARAYIEDPAPRHDARRCVAHLEIQEQIERMAARVGGLSPVAQHAAAQLHDKIQKRGDERDLLPLYFLALMAVVMCHRAANNHPPA